MTTNKYSTTFMINGFINQQDLTEEQVLFLVEKNLTGEAVLMTVKDSNGKDALQNILLRPQRH